MKSVLKDLIIRILTWEAKAVLRKYNPKIIAITGSVGKTSTKDAIFSVLSHFYFVRKSEKSFNSEFGVPLTILGCPSGWSDPLVWVRNILEGLALIILPNHYPEWLVLEIGADSPGDIETIAGWIKPDITVVTRLSKVPVHVEFFPTVEDVFQEKSFLVSALKPEGILILNADDEDVLGFQNLVDNRSVLFGRGEGAQVVGKNYEIAYENRDGDSIPVGTHFTAIIEGSEEANVAVRGALGIQQFYPALAALSVAHALNLPLRKAAESLKTHVPPPGRMRILHGIKKSLIIDDSYNSSPVALESALETLEALKVTGRKVAVLGDMLELGIHSTEEHKKGGFLAGSSADILFTVGIRARGFVEGALQAGMSEANIFQYEDSRIAGKDLEIMMREGDTVLVKGSQGVRMERVVEEILATPLQKDKLLVRQDEAWKNR